MPTVHKHTHIINSFLGGYTVTAIFMGDRAYLETDYIIVEVILLNSLINIKFY